MRAGRGTGRRWAAAGTAAVVLALAACSSPPLVEFPDGPGGAVDAAPPDVVGPLRFRGRELVDADGRVVQIHGVNLVRKAAPFIATEDPGWLSDGDLDAMRRSGFNGVRLGVWADALLPEPGVLDADYLAAVERAVDRLADAGMWVLLDFHQDVFTGLPDWATTPGAAALSPEPPALLAPLGWAAAYASPRSLRQWEDWWARVPVADGRSAVDLFGDGVEAVAARFADHPAVIGIDLLNEPFPGERFFDCVAGSCTGRYAQLTSMYAELTARVRSAAPSMPVWWAPFNFGPPFQGTADPGDGVGYTFHSYCVGTDGGEPVAPDPLAAALCGAVYDTAVTDAVGVSRRWDAPVLLGEFGASHSPLNSTRLTELADQRLLSWLHWHWGSYPEVVRTNLVRVYAQATAGRPTLQRFDPATGEFVLRYVPDPVVEAPTSVVVPPEPYPDGYVAAVTGGRVTSAPDAGRLTVVADPGSTEVEVRVGRAAAG